MNNWDLARDYYRCQQFQDKRENEISFLKNNINKKYIENIYKDLGKKDENRKSLQSGR